MSTKITAPVKQLGEVTTTFGPHTVTFKEGVADVEFDISDGLKSYLLTAGYGLDGTPAREPEIAAEPLDPRDTDLVSQTGSSLRDAAVDPRPDDFLAPTNAGEANPHGPAVVSPEIHASQGVRPVKGGDVTFDNDTAKQSDSETLHADAATDGTPVVVTAEEKANDTDAGAPDSESLKGAALDDALGDAGLPKSGTADEKRARLAEHREGQSVL